MTNGAHRISKTDLMKSLNYLISSPDFKINAPAEDHRAVMQALALAAWPARKFLAPRQP